MIVKTTDRRLLIGQLMRQGVRRLEITPLAGGNSAETLAVAKVAWMARIVWSNH